MTTKNIFCPSFSPSFLDKVTPLDKGIFLYLVLPQIAGFDFSEKDQYQVHRRGATEAGALVLVCVCEGRRDGGITVASQSL